MRILAILFLLLTLETSTLGALAAGIDWRHDLSAAAAEAKSSNKLLFVEIGAPWCGPCRSLEKLAKNKALGEWVAARFVSVHLEADDPGGKALLRKFGMNGIPALIVFDASGNFKNKKSGAPADVESLKLSLTELAGGEAAFNSFGGSSGGFNTGFQQQDQNFGADTTGGAPAPPQNPQQSQQGYQQFQQQPQYQQQYPQVQQGYQQQYPQQYQHPQQSYQQPQQQFQQSQQGFQQPYPQPVMQWQGQTPAPQQWQSNTSGQYAQPAQYPQQGGYSQQPQYPQQIQYPQQMQTSPQGQYPQQWQTTQQGQYPQQGQYQSPNQAMPNQMPSNQMSPNQYAQQYPQLPNPPQK